MNTVAERSDKLTPAYGAAQSESLWNGFLARFDVSWSGATVLDWGCSWGYLLRRLVDVHGVGRAIGVDIREAWAEAPAELLAGLELHAGDIRRLPDLQELQADVIVSVGTMFLLAPTDVQGVLSWFRAHLRPGGLAVLSTRTFLSHAGGDLHRRLSTPYPHLLFPRRVIDAELTADGGAPSRYMNPSCGATYLMQYQRAGFEILDARRRSNPGLAPVLERFGDKLEPLDAQELDTNELQVLLRRPAQPRGVARLGSRR